MFSLALMAWMSWVDSLCLMFYKEHSVEMIIQLERCKLGTVHDTPVSCQAV